MDFKLYRRNITFLNIKMWSDIMGILQQYIKADVNKENLLCFFCRELSFFQEKFSFSFWGIKIKIAVVKIMTVLQNLKCTFGWSFDYNLISGIIKIKGLNVCTLRVDAFKVGRLSQEFNLLFIVFAKICVFIKQNSFLSDMHLI